MKLATRMRSAFAIFAVLATCFACGEGPEEPADRDFSSGEEGERDAGAKDSGGGTSDGSSGPDPECVPTDCIVLGAGQHADDGCGKPIDCGSNPCTDTKEGNDTLETASDVGDMSDNPDSSRLYTDLTLSDTDVDWFVANVADTGFGGNPTMTVTTSAALEVLIVFSCTSKPDSSICKTGTVDTTLGTGCIGTTTVSLETSCAGTTDSGKAYIRVKKKAGTNACTLYTLDIKVV
jgi:hypothetical protein